jgi:hypothetical protein
MITTTDFSEKHQPAKHDSDKIESPWHQATTPIPRQTASVRSGIAETRKHHQVDVAPGRLAPFPKLRRQGPLLLGQGLRLKILETLMDQIKGIVDQLGGLFGSHGTAGEGRGVGMALL